MKREAEIVMIEENTKLIVQIDLSHVPRAIFEFVCTPDKEKMRDPEYRKRFMDTFVNLVDFYYPVKEG